MAKGEKKVSDEQLTGSSYIISFYNEITMLNHQYAIYNNVLVELGNKYPTSKIDLTEEHYNHLVNVIQTTRYYITKAYILYNGLKEKLKTLQKDKGKDKIKEIYGKLQQPEHFIISRADLFELVTEFNKILLDNVMKDILQTSRELINNLYSEE